MEYIKLLLTNNDKIKEMSEMASAIVREYYDPILGTAQNDYMLEKFQSEAAIRSQIEQGYQYYFVKENHKNLGFLAFYPRGEAMYLSKFYLYKEERQKGYGRKIIDFVIRCAKAAGLSCIELNVNRNNNTITAYEKLGFKRIRSEKIDIGSGYFMDDHVYRLEF